MDYFDDPNLCLICFGYHPLKYCKYFKTFTTIQRIYLVNVHRYCPKCFSKAHLLEECTLRDSCSKCNGQHHTMLHQLEDECAAHDPCHPLHECRSVACGICEASRFRRMHGNTPYRTFKSFRNEQTFCSATPCTTMPQRTLDAQMAGTSKGMHKFGTRCSEPYMPTSSRGTRLLGFGYPEASCSFTPSNPSFLARTLNRQTSTFSSSNFPFTTAASRWLESVPQSSTENPLQRCCKHQTLPYVSGSPINMERQENRKDARVPFPNTQPVRFSSVSPKSESFSELSFDSVAKKSLTSSSSECPMKRSRLERLSFSIRRSRSPSIESECCVNDREQRLHSRSAPKVEPNITKTDSEHKAFTPKAFFPQAGTVPLHSPTPPKLLANDNYETTQARPDSGGKSQPATRTPSAIQTLIGETQSKHKGVPKRSRGHKANPPMIQHPQLHQIQLYLQQLLGHLKGPKEYWHTPANRRRQTLLRQELSQLKSQLKQLIQDIQRYPNMQTQLSSTRRQQEDLKTLFHQLLSLLQKCHALSSSRQLISSIQQLKEHLQHQVDATTPNNNGEMLSFQPFLQELQNLEGSCLEKEKGKRVDLLQKRLGLRILLRHLLKAALEQLTDMLS